MEKQKDLEVYELLELLRDLTRKEREAAELRGDRVIPLPPEGRLSYPKKFEYGGVRVETLSEAPSSPVEASEG